jgi:hypothetical protein
MTTSDWTESVHRFQATDPWASEAADAIRDAQAETAEDVLPSEPRRMSALACTLHGNYWWREGCPGCPDPVKYAEAYDRLDVFREGYARTFQAKAHVAPAPRLTMPDHYPTTAMGEVEALRGHGVLGGFSVPRRVHSSTHVLMRFLRRHRLYLQVWRCACGEGGTSRGGAGEPAYHQWATHRAALLTAIRKGRSS